jgi:hypothetical protein
MTLSTESRNDLALIGPLYPLQLAPASRNEADEAVATPRRTPDELVTLALVLPLALVLEDLAALAGDDLGRGAGDPGHDRRGAAELLVGLRGLLPERLRLLGVGLSRGQLGLGELGVGRGMADRVRGVIDPRADPAVTVTLGPRAARGADT